MQAEKGDLNSMQITDVRVRKVTKEGKLKAVVSITIDNEFVVHDIKVIEGEKGLFIAMPSRKATDGEYRDIADVYKRQDYTHKNPHLYGRKNVHNSVDNVDKHGKTAEILRFLIVDNFFFMWKTGDEMCINKKRTFI